ncbi:MAG: AAA family ATPase [Burkholderiales bacterium]|nr:AAA family ATPase [Burkholderiales bacterium]
MYTAFFGLQQEPFSIAPDPRFLYMSDKHREALQLLGYGLTRGASFVLLTGEIGAGKTTVWRRFLEELPSNYDVASVVNPKLDTNALLARVFEDLNVDLPADAKSLDLIDALHGHLLLAHAQGRRTLIVIDEAQALSNEVLEQLRLLTNLDSSGRKLQVMLIGQPELRQMLQQPQLEPLAQRVVARYHLPALSESETAGYIAHRLAVAGLKGPMPFDGESLGLIHQLCRGVPRRINVICDRAMSNAQAAGSRRVDRHAVDRAVEQVYGAKASPALESSAGSGGMGGVNPWAAALVAAGALAAGVWLAPRLTATTTSTVAATDAASTPTNGGAVSAPTPTPAVLAAPAMPAPTDTSTAPLAAPSTAKASPALPTPNAAPVIAAAGPATTKAALAAVSLDTVFATAVAADEATAWRALANLWGASLGPGEPCNAAAAQSLLCFRSRGGLAEVRQLDRPGIVRLVDARGRTAHALLTAFNGEQATLGVGGVVTTVPLAELARVWRGEFATFWRAPPGYREGDITSTAAGGAWLAQRLAAADGQAGAAASSREALRARVAAYQLGNGLTPDGVAGPLTLMQLGRASDEPRLARR